jgi:Xaa-Pro aminopeptidase
MVKVDAKLAGKVDVLLVTTLDDIDWITNLRGNDIQCNPVFFSYLLFHASKVDQKSRIQLFIN